MTRKDYKAIAAGFASNEPPAGSTLRRLQWLEDINEVARVFAADNPRFDRARFFKACGSLPSE